MPIKCRCGAEFEPRSHNARYCSSRCKRSEENAGKREARARVRTDAGLLRVSPSPSKDMRLFAWPDTHVGYESPAACTAALKAMEIFKPTVVAVLGDFLDLEGPSSFPSRPTTSHGLRLQQDIDRSNEWLDQIQQAAGDARVVFTLGNHEARLEKTLMAKSPEFYGLRCLTVPELLGLDRRDIEWCDYEQCIELMPGIVATHGKMLSKHSGWTAQKEADRWQVSGVSGHVHRLGIYYQTTYDYNRFWIESGFLGSLEVPGASLTSNWQQGFATLVVEGGHAFPETHPIYNGMTYIDGKVVRA